MPAPAGYCYMLKFTEVGGKLYTSYKAADIGLYATSKPAIGVAIQPASSLGMWTTSGYRFRLTKTLEAVIHSNRTGN